MRLGKIHNVIMIGQIFQGYRCGTLYGFIGTLVVHVSVTNAGHMVTMATSSAKHPQDILKETLMVT